LHVSIA
jgi:nucleolar complex protein 3